jgi:hypothetical protein
LAALAQLKITREIEPERRPPVCVRLKPQNVARLARERPADRIERRKADRARLTDLEDGKVGQHHSDPIRELGQRHPPIVKEVVKLDGDRHVTPPLRGLRA